jgi:Cu+-exporting ATPase
MQATTAKIVMRVGEKEKIFEADANTVKIGDEIQVNEGDLIPVDGVVISGSAFVNEATITGESEPIEKEKENRVFSGTILTNGNMRIRTEKIAKESTLQQIIELVKKARKDQPNIQKLGDKVSGIFVPVVLGISALTFILAFWAFDIGLTKSLMNAVAVLVISCPCAMGLATPTAVVAGVGRAAKKGILIKGGATLENFAQTQTIIFDKTGTLTSGQFEMTVNSNEIGDRLFPIILGLESNSSHPIAQSLTRSLGHTEAEDLLDIKEVKGKGMTGTSPSGEIFFFGKNTEPEKDYDLQLTLDGKQVATLDIEDEILPNAKEMVRFFESQGLKTLILSGDRDKKVKRVATTLGINEYHGGMSPEGKLTFISDLAKKENIAMVGDGINDGPALSLAQVGISAKGASALAVDSAKIAIMGSKEMEGIMQSYLVSKHTYKTIKQNLFWAFAYNVVAIPIAAFGFLNPMVAALAMAFSDVIVIGNSLRLKVKKLK